MLNISHHSTLGNIDTSEYSSFSEVSLSNSNKMLTRWLMATLAIVLIIMFLPWTQNIQSEGKVTTLRPEQRPQTIPSTIAGKIDKWYVTEGQLVKKGDTIVHLTEIKTDYFDPELISRTELQVAAKKSTLRSYDSKVQALNNQIEALKSEWIFKQQQLRNKIRQARLKITSDSIELEQARINLEIAERQFNRTSELHEKGLKSLTDKEDKNLTLQSANAKKVAVENKLLSNRNELINAQLELSTLQYDFNQKVAKAESEKYSTLSSKYDGEANLNKLKIESTNYSRRSSFYYITAPQDCYITKVIKTGIGEMVKENEPVITIMPSDFQLAVELYIQPIDLPLIDTSQLVSFMFDGWPAFVFSGWPNLAFGTFQGKVVAIDNDISDNGRYRILVAPSPKHTPWPKALRPGSGAQGILLLKDVPVWYELWRQLNGFPPDFYDKEEIKKPKLSAPVKSIPK